MAVAGVILSIGSKYGPGGLASLQAGIQMLGQLASSIRSVMADAGAYADMMTRLKIDIMAATKASANLIDPIDHVRGAMKLTEAGINLTTERFAALSVAAADYAGAVGGDATTEFNKLVDAVRKGNENALKPLGIELTNCTTLAEKQSKAFSELEKRSKGTTVEVSNFDARLTAAGNSMSQMTNAILMSTGNAFPALDDALERVTELANAATQSILDVFNTVRDVEKRMKGSGYDESRYREVSEKADEARKTLGLKSGEDAGDLAALRQKKIAESKKAGLTGQIFGGVADPSQVIEAVAAIENERRMKATLALAGSVNDLKNANKELADADAKLLEVLERGEKMMADAAKGKGKKGGGGGGKRAGAAVEAAPDLASMTGEQRLAVFAKEAEAQRTLAGIEAERAAFMEVYNAAFAGIADTSAAYTESEVEVWEQERVAEEREMAYLERRSAYMAQYAETEEVQWEREREADEEEAAREERKIAYLDQYADHHKTKLGDMIFGDIAYQKQSEAMWKSSMSNKLRMVGMLVSGWSGLMDKENKKQFKAWQALAIVEATIAGLVGSIETYKALCGMGPVGPIIGAIAAASVIAQTIVTVAKIKKQKYNSGGGGGADTGGGFKISSPSAGAGSAPESTQGNQKLEITNIVTLDGEKVYENVQQHNNAALRAGRGGAFEKVA
jgi:hypothetical protein